MKRKKRNHIVFAVILTALAGVSTVPAITADNPYVSPITNINIFGLKPPPLPVDPATTIVQPPLPNVTLSGITTILGKKMAVLRVPRPARPPEPAKEVSVMLNEGSPAEEGIRVLEINVAAGTVRIMNGATEQTLDIIKNAPKSAPASAAPAGLPVPPPSGGLPIPPPKPAAAPPVTSINRPMRGAGALGGDQSKGIPGAGPAGIAQPQEPPVITPDEQMVLIELERDRIKDAVAAGDLPPLPPTDFSEEMEKENQANQQSSGMPGGAGF